MATALYPGTFDPVTHGHLDLLRRGLALFERVVVAVGARADKKTLFSAEERVGMIRDSVALAGLPRVTVEPFTGLVVDAARRHGATVLLRGVRNPGDAQYEAQMAAANEKLAPGLETVVLFASAETAFLSSSLIKEILQAGGAVDAFVPAPVAKALKLRR
jgi:pantetheine-phosphate adenylyltransferase